MTTGDAPASTGVTEVVTEGLDEVDVDGAWPEGSPALATGADVAHLGLPPGIWALDTANADIGAMVRWVAMNRGAMTPQGQQIFTDLERLGLDLRQRGSENDGDQEVFIP